jgi:hypothetical protein
MESSDPVRTVDSPDFALGKGESVSIPMRFCVDEDNQPIVADGLKDLLSRQNDMAFDFEI